MSSADVAVVIPARNASSTIVSTLESVRNQTMAPGEILVVDDGSSDNTVELALSLGAKVVSGQGGGGPSAARNAGVKETQSPLIALLDADDWWHPRKLEAQLEVLASRPAAVAVATDWVRHPNDWPESISAGTLSTISYSDLLTMNQFQTSTVLMRKEIFDRIGGFLTELDGVEDWDCWLRLSRYGPIIKIDAPYVAYRDSPGGVSKDLTTLYRRMWVMLERERELGAMGLKRRDLDTLLTWHHLRFAVNWILEGERGEAYAVFGRIKASGLLKSIPAASIRYLMPFLNQRLKNRLRARRSRG